MPGLLKKQEIRTIPSQRTETCPCNGCPCTEPENKLPDREKKMFAKNGIQLPKYRQPRSDTYSHSTYRKEFCSKQLMKQHAVLAHRKFAQRAIPASVPQNGPFKFKSTAEEEYRKYTAREIAACQATFKRTKRKEDFYFKPGEFKSDVPFPMHPFSHEQYSPKEPIAIRHERKITDYNVPPFGGVSCYDRDYAPPPKEAYANIRRVRKKCAFD